MNYAIYSPICRFARVLHVRDFIRAYGEYLHASGLLLARFVARVQGLGPCCPSGMRTKGGSCGGVIYPPSSNHPSEAGRRSVEVPLMRVRMHASSARNECAPGHSTYLMITVPIDTMFIFNNLQLFSCFSWCQIVLFFQTKKGRI